MCNRVTARDAAYSYSGHTVTLFKFLNMYNQENIGLPLELEGLCLGTRLGKKLEYVTLSIPVVL